MRPEAPRVRSAWPSTSAACAFRSRRGPGRRWDRDGSDRRTGPDPHAEVAEVVPHRRHGCAATAPRPRARPARAARTRRHRGTTIRGVHRWRGARARRGRSRAIGDGHPARRWRVKHPAPPGAAPTRARRRSRRGRRRTPRRRSRGGRSPRRARARRPPRPPLLPAAARRDVAPAGVRVRRRRTGVRVGARVGPRGVLGRVLGRWSGRSIGVVGASMHRSSGRRVAATIGNVPERDPEAPPRRSWASRMPITGTACDHRGRPHRREPAPTDSRSRTCSTPPVRPPPRGRP